MLTTDVQKNTITSNTRFKSAPNYYQEFEDFILENDHPCVMAQTTFKQNSVNFEVFEESLDSASVTARLFTAIKDYIQSYQFESNDFETLIAAFPNHPQVDERSFERSLWKQLQLLHELDTKDWDATVSADPDDSKFSFSLNGVSFYIVGMHPNSSRAARKAPFTTLVFNLHWQFEKLRAMNVYNNVRDRIRQRDANKNGSINPMLKDFGKQSEAKQYSGRAVDNSWKCPFLNKNAEIS